MVDTCSSMRKSVSRCNSLHLILPSKDTANLITKAGFILKIDDTADSNDGVKEDCYYPTPNYKEQLERGVGEKGDRELVVERIVHP